MATAFAVFVGGGVISANVGLTAWSTIGYASTTVLVVLASMLMCRVWWVEVLGQGAEEFRRLGRGLFAAAVVLALGGLAVGASSVRLWVFLVVPAIAVLAFPARYVLRRWLHHERRSGLCLLPVMAAGSPETLRDLIKRTRSAPHLGWRVDAVCTVDGRGSDVDGDFDGVPVVGRLEDLSERARRGGYRIVAVTADSYWTPNRLQRLAWDLEGSGAEMVVAPVLMEVAGPRLHVTGVLGMPLLRVSEPTFTGARRVVKGVVDRIGAALLITLLTPLMLIVSMLIAVDSRGPVFYKQRRVGKDGDEFTIVKFRTMVTDAHAKRAELVHHDEGAGLLFKIRRDPRITRVGSVLRRYSIDELPQLFNVVTGSMSLVGPRPPLPEESARYADHVRRRLLVKPGLTGLWQVSGRSDLPWEEAVRLDLRYVEDWSLALDAVILWKTFRAVFSGQGAY
ncbi:exopolysaccharide biosynthesis polyprenyl glycosylphosphotransferase [Herbihabitans rhizosphaerae]|uniref:Exopolysaccharide biosynthesis polyprenyl glycosylphosphotransferase n=1 Tax=Herbihabitans rhizosphaerae TaxID=1872711 RepID=A0A4V2ETF9_9PSEU|nr:sugar transferase [Herbihabitans rhizosphaerae]RZS40933.1 exopolysaccharide biosynthesis polyprenyl glycosylphosphotransferase [Herbihabitans rhizosphaerae]